MCKSDEKFGRMRIKHCHCEAGKEGLLRFARNDIQPSLTSFLCQPKQSPGFYKLLTVSLVIYLLIVSFLNNTAFSDTQLSTGTMDDTIKVEVIGDEIVGMNTSTNVRVVEKLKEGEVVTSALSKGSIGAVLTDRRLLGFNATNNTWSSFGTFFNKAVFPNEIKVSSTMAVAIAKRRVYAFTSIANKWEFELVSFLEETISSEINENYIFIRTNKRFIAFSFKKQEWFPENLFAYETIKSISTGENYITIVTEGVTEGRIVTFDAKNGKWAIEFTRPGAEQQTTDITSPSGGRSINEPPDKT